MSNGQYVHAAISQVHNNTDQELIQITDDKLRLILKDHLSRVEKGKEWLAPSGIMVSVIGVFVSAEFKDAFGLKAATWQAIFIIFALFSTCWLIKCLISLAKSPSLEDVVNSIKNSPTPP